jgi:hypothetical protein
MGRKEFERYALIAVVALVLGFVLGLAAPRQSEPDWQTGDLPAGKVIVGLYNFGGELVPMLVCKTNYAGIWTYSQGGLSEEIITPDVWAHIPVSMYMGGYK